MRPVVQLVNGAIQENHDHYHLCQPVLGSIYAPLCLRLGRGETSTHLCVSVLPREWTRRIKGQQLSSYLRTSVSLSCRGQGRQLAGWVAGGAAAGCWWPRRSCGPQLPARPSLAPPAWPPPATVNSQSLGLRGAMVSIAASHAKRPGFESRMVRVWTLCVTH